MSSILDLVTSQLDSQAIGALGEQIGADPGTTRQAVQSALPLLVGALASNARSADGAGSLLGAVTRDHDGSILDDVLGALTSSGTPSLGASILGHVLGSKQEAVAQGVGQHAGLSRDQVMRLLAMLAPLVMGALGRQQRTQGLDAGMLSQWLGQERQSATQRHPQAGGLLGSLLDRDGDGSIADDVGRMGLGMLGNMLGRDRN